ncbi:uncharacterized protein LOC141704493 isoform X2 [Apium graveolens]|uniref:uncharacterized protein LOC141704493 isoform X2 n=1 Tax=Apium graveolens TaxID=4045 RepID=UPI003D7AAC2E
MSTDESRKVSGQDIQAVQNLIEQCLIRYMTRKEVMNFLSLKKNIEPAVTELVWQKLEQENQEFFNAYNLRLTLKEQIAEFNKLLDRQVKMMHHADTSGVSYRPVSASHVSPKNAGHALMTESMRQPITTNIPNEFNNRGLSVPCMQIPVDISGQSRKSETSNVMLAQNQNIGMAQRLNGGMLKREAGYSGMSQFIYGSDNNIMETHPLSTDASNLLYSDVESHTLPSLNEAMLDAADTTNFGLLGNYGISDLTTEFSNSSDLMDNYRSPFLETAQDNFLDLQSRGDNQGPNTRLNGFGDFHGD